MSVNGSLPVGIANELRKLKALLFSIRSRVCILRKKLKRKSQKGTVVLLSLGAQKGSPMLARAAFEQGYDIHVIAPCFPSYEGLYATGWTKANPVDDIDGTVAAARCVNPVACLVEIRNILLPAKTRIQSELGLRSFGDVSPASSNSKIYVRELIDQTNLPKMRWARAKDYKTGELGYPFIVKPETGTGSKGVALVHSDEELKEALEAIEALRGDVAVGGDVLLEEYIDGENYDVTGIYRDGQIYPFTVQLMEFTPIDGAMPSSFYLHNPPIENSLRERLISRAKDYIEALGVTVGAFTCEMRMKSDGELFVTDFGNRCATPPTVSKAAGLSLPGTYVRAMCDETFEPPKIERNCVYQRFVRDADEVSRFDAFLKEYPDAAVDVRKMASSYAGVKTLARISVWAPDFDTLHDKLKRFDLIPDEWIAAGFSRQ